MTFVSLEVMRDCGCLGQSNSAELSELEDLLEEVIEKEAGEKTGSGWFEIDITFDEQCQCSYLRELIYNRILNAHDLKYDRLDQKVVLPPPEFLI